MHEAGDRQAVFRLVVVDAVAPGDQRPRLIHLVVAAPQDVVDRFHGHLLRDRHDVEAELGLPTHGVYVGQGVSGGDLPEQIGIVGDRREEIHGLDQGKFI